MDREMERRLGLIQTKEAEENRRMGRTKKSQRRSQGLRERKGELNGMLGPANGPFYKPIRFVYEPKGDERGQTSPR